MPKDIAKSWEEAMKRGVPRWRSHTLEAVSRWAENTGKAFGVTVGTKTRSAYEEGVKSISTEDFASAVKGKGKKLVEKAREGLAL